MLTLVLVILLVLILFGGVRAGPVWNPDGNVVVLVLVIVVLFLLFGGGVYVVNR